jgi:hypothetical protein
MHIIHFLYDPEPLLTLIIFTSSLYLSQFLCNLQVGKSICMLFSCAGTHDKSYAYMRAAVVQYSGRYQLCLPENLLFILFSCCQTPLFHVIKAYNTIPCVTELYRLNFLFLLWPFTFMAKGHQRGHSFFSLRNAKVFLTLSVVIR